MKSFLLIPITLLLIISCSFENEPINNINYEESLKDSIQFIMEKYEVPGVQVAVYKDPEDERFSLSLGYSNVDTKTELTNFTRIKAGSITKSFTGIGILKLVQKGMINLDDSLGKYLDLNDKSYDGIRIGKLLNMHSGLRGYLNDDAAVKIIDDVITNPEKQYSPEELVNYGYQLTKDLGTTGENEFHYTNTNYILLGMIIERVTGQTYSDFIRQEITEPLGLLDTYIPIDNNYPANVSGGYYVDLDENNVDDFSAIDMSYVWSAGAVITTASDLCKWMNLIGNDEVISGLALNYVYDGLEIAEGAYYTSGLMNEPLKLWHNGTVLGAHGEMCYLKDSGYSIAVLTNCNVVGVEGDPVSEIMEYIISEFSE